MQMVNFLGDAVLKGPMIFLDGASPETFMPMYVVPTVDYYIQKYVDGQFVLEYHRTAYPTEPTYIPAFLLGP